MLAIVMFCVSLIFLCLAIVNIKSPKYYYYYDMFVTVYLLAFILLLPFFVDSQSLEKTNKLLVYILILVVYVVGIPGLLRCIKDR